MNSVTGNGLVVQVDIDTIFQPMFQGQSDPFVGFREAPRAAGK